jgi:hypothetical protein
MVAAFFSIGSMLIAGWWTRRKDRAGIGDPEEFEDDVEDFVRPVVRDEPVEVEQTYQTPSYSTPSYSRPVTPAAPAAPTQANVDPLTLDARTRYKMMKSQSRFSSSARNNLWGGGHGSAYGARREEERDY